MVRRGVLVFGGGGRIGSAIVRELSQRNVPVVVADVTSTQLPDQSDLPWFKVDATVEEQMRHFCEQAFAKFEIGAVINSTYPPMTSAGIPPGRDSVADVLADINRHIACGYLISKLFGSHLADQGGGSIVHISSIYGSKVPRFEIYESEAFSMPVAYAVAKAGLQMMSQYFAELFKKSGVRFNCVSPGGVVDGHSADFRSRYGRYSMGSDLLKVEQIATAAAFLASPESSAVTGQNLIVDEGWSL